MSTLSLPQAPFEQELGQKRIHKVRGSGTMNTALHDALSPVAARSQKIVREHEILRVAGMLIGKDPTKSAAAAREEVLKWAQKRCGGKLPPESWTFQAFEYFSGGRNSSGLRIQTKDADIWSIRADDPDKTTPERVWTTEVTIGGRPGYRPQFSARLLVSTPENVLDIEPHTPGFVQQVVESCGLMRGAYDLSVEPTLVGSINEADQIADMLADPDRRLPVLVLTVPDNAADSNRPLLDAPALARATLGLAHVVILPAAYTWRLTERFGKQRSVFNGAVRAYLPGFSDDASPFTHRLAIADHISDQLGAARCVRWMRTLAASESIKRSRLDSEILSFSSIKSASLELRQRELESEGASDSERLQAAIARIDALEKQSTHEKASLEYFASEHEKAEHRAAVAEEQARASTYRIQQLLEQLRTAGQEIDSNIELPTKWEEVANWADINLSGRLVVTPAARRGLRAPEFEDIAAVARCLLWLANVCRDRRLAGGQGTINDEIVEDGIRNSHCGSDEFDFTWHGQTYTADWHVKSGGNSRDPKRCLRIYYGWDEATQQIIVADLPAHRRSGAS